MELFAQSRSQAPGYYIPCRVNIGMQILAPISVGELIDKITILELKQEYIHDQAKQINITRELQELNLIRDGLDLEDITAETQELLAVNRALWHIEDFKRSCEHTGRFDRAFTQAAREVYLKNDQRAEIKRRINTKSGSDIVEEKSYAGH